MQPATVVMFGMDYITPRKQHGIEHVLKLRNITFDIINPIFSKEGGKKC